MTCARIAVAMRLEGMGFATTIFCCKDIENKMAEHL